MNSIMKLLRSAVSIASAVAVGLSAAATELARIMPEESETVVAWLVRIVAWLGVAISIYTTHTTVPRPLWGFDPPPGEKVVVTTSGAMVGPDA